MVTSVEAERVRLVLGWLRAEMAAFLGVRPGVLAYWLRRGRLAEGEGVLLARLGGVLVEAARVLHGEEAGAAWLQAGIISLGGGRPVDLLVSLEGYERVRNKLVQIEYGMYG